jgi:hypothetical protein
MEKELLGRTSNLGQGPPRANPSPCVPRCRSDPDASLRTASVRHHNRCPDFASPLVHPTCVILCRCPYPSSAAKLKQSSCSPPRHYVKPTPALLAPSSTSTPHRAVPTTTAAPRHQRTTRGHHLSVTKPTKHRAASSTRRRQELKPPPIFPGRRAAPTVKSFTGRPLAPPMPPQ